MLPVATVLIVTSLMESFFFDKKSSAFLDKRQNRSEVQSHQQSKAMIYDLPVAIVPIILPRSWRRSFVPIRLPSGRLPSVILPWGWRWSFVPSRLPSVRLPSVILSWG